MTEPALAVALLWLLFGGTHIGLAMPRVRAALIARIGERGFFVLFSLVALLTFAALVAYYAAHRFEGAAGPGLAAVAPLRWALLILIVAGLTLAGAGLVIYPRLPTALFEPPIRTPHGLERITRHPFFVGVAIFAGAHVLLATRLAGVVFFAGFAALAVAGAYYQDAKLLRLRGQPYADYLAATSVLPFGAVLSGRQRIAWREISPFTLAAGLCFALALRSIHGSILADGGIWMILSLLVGSALASLGAWRRKRKLAAG